jgi:hypothetical protein
MKKRAPKDLLFEQLAGLRLEHQASDKATAL